MRNLFKPAFILAAAALLAGCMQIIPALGPKAKNVEENISAGFPYESRFVEVNGSRMHYVEAGQGDPIVLVHGNPTSAYLWRNIIPHLESQGRVIALDLIGFGQSGKPDIAYRFADHADYFAGFIDALGLENVTLVLHDWGGGIGLDYAANNPANVRAIAVMEAVIMPMDWDGANIAEKYIFGQFRDPERGFELNAERNYFVERMLPMMAGRNLSDEEMAAYRAPFPTVESRRPVAQWPIELPMGGEPADNVARIGANYEWLQNADTPVLLIHAEPGAIFKPEIVEQIQSDIPRLETRSAGSGMHYIQETQPTLIGTHLAEWLAELDV